MKKAYIGIISFAIVLLLMPIGHILMSLLTNNYTIYGQLIGAGMIGLLGLGLLIIGSTSKKEITACINGLLSGILIWTGWIEFSFVLYAEKLNIVPLIEEGIVTTRPEYLLMASSLGLLLAFVSIWMVSSTTRCNMFMWIQNKILPKIKRSGLKHTNHAMITSLETVSIIWFFYLVLLISYDDHFFGTFHPVTYGIFFLSLLWSAYLIKQLLRFNNFAKAIRYAIPTVVIFWNSIEILGRWDFFTEFWIDPNKFWLESILIIVVLIVILSWSWYENLHKNATN